jgi:hypothetical protein
VLPDKRRRPVQVVGAVALQVVKDDPVTHFLDQQLFPSCVGSHRISFPATLRRELVKNSDRGQTLAGLT